MYLGWNDYELIYLIKEGNELALNLMYRKYSNFIRIKARKLGFKSYFIDDCVQEGLLLLTKALMVYDSKYNKSFWSFFNLILERRLWRYHKQIQTDEVIMDDLDLVDQNRFKEKIKEYGTILKDSYLQKIYEEIFFYRTSVNDLARMLEVKPAKIYADLKKIKEILRLQFDL